MSREPGLGKTLIAKVIANELRTRALSLGLEPVPFVETYAANLNSVAALDAQAQRLVGRGGIWFIDEIHVLNKELATKLYLLMEDGRYPFDGSATPTDMPDVMLIGATTDYGGLHAALKRRFGEPMMVRALTRHELLSLARKLGHPIEDDAAELLVSRCWQSGAPFELKILFRECTIFAQAIGAASITRSVVEDVFTTYEIDEHGLRPIDRSVLAALFNRPRYRGKNQDFYCYGASESDVCSVARLDKAEFQETIRPKLLSRGFIEVRAGVGLVLTAPAVSRYLHRPPSGPRAGPTPSAHPGCLPGGWRRRRREKEKTSLSPPTMSAAATLGPDPPVPRTPLKEAEREAVRFAPPPSLPIQTHQKPWQEKP